MKKFASPSCRFPIRLLGDYHPFRLRCLPDWQRLHFPTGHMPLGQNTSHLHCQARPAIVLCCVLFIVLCASSSVVLCNSCACVFEYVWCLCCVLCAVYLRVLMCVQFNARVRVRMCVCAFKCLLLCVVCVVYFVLCVCYADVILAES